jgi:amphi-Trp domain-containing protein
VGRWANVPGDLTDHFGSVRLGAHIARPNRELGQVTAAIPAAFRGRARRDAAAFYLTQLAKGVLAGELGVVTGHGQTALVTSEFLVLEIEVKQKKRANHVKVKLRWPNLPNY